MFLIPDNLTCFNNVLIRFGELKDPMIIVAGGLTYNEFEKFCKVLRYTDSLGIQLFSEDPVGKLMDPELPGKAMNSFICA